MSSKKIYILDTNVLLHDPQSMFSFTGAHIGIPTTVLEELDKFKSETVDRGRNAREAIRQLDALRARGSLRDGIELDNGGFLRILFPSEMPQTSPFLLKNEDNQILLTALALKHEDYDVVFVSKDINARVKADVLGIKAEDYLKGKITEYDIYKGWRKLILPGGQLRKDVPEELEELLKEEGLEINEFVMLQSAGNPFNYKVVRYLGGNRFKNVEAPTLRWPIEPKNPQQLMTLDLLMDESIQMICLVGPAGTGKTFLALLAALHQILIEDKYEKLLVSRPVVPLGSDIGYLPGDIQEKLRSWMQPIYDNMDLIAHAAMSRKHLDTLREEGRGRREKRRKERDVIKPLDEMIYEGKLALEAITYMRGRSIPYQFILIDEVQNLTPHEVKTLITRVGVGSKIILAGDPYQIDSPYLDFSGNGLVVASNRFKGQSLFGTVFLETTERSELSRLASELL